MSNTCDRCGNKLNKNQQRWCSPNCSRLGLKAEYRKRNRDKINTYNREYRSNGNRRPLNKERRHKLIEERGNACENCKNKEDLEVHHIRPLANKGTHEKRNLLVLCKKCHAKWEKRMQNYWY